MYDEKLREEHSSSQRDTGYGENQQPNKAPRRNSRGRYPPTSESEDDDSWKERMRTAGRAHERPEKMKRAKDTRNSEESQAKRGKNEWSQRNWDDYPRPSEETGVKEDYEPARETRQREEKTKGHREAGDRECSQANGKEEREWLTELQPRLEALLQLRNMIETMEADVKDMELEDAEILQDERTLRSRTACHTSIWDQIRENEEIEQARKHAERFQARTSARIKLGWAENELKPLEDDYKTFLSLQSRQRKEQADRLEATLRAATDYYAQQEAYEKWARKKETPEKVAREKEERRREAEANQREVRREHDERESARNEARRAEHRETQKDEAIRRQHVLEKINKQKQGTMRQESRSSQLNGPKRNESGPEPGHVRTSESDFASSPERTRQGDHLGLATTSPGSERAAPLRHTNQARRVGGILRNSTLPTRSKQIVTSVERYMRIQFPLPALAACYLAPGVGLFHRLQAGVELPRD